MSEHDRTRNDTVGVSDRDARRDERRTRIFASPFERQSAEPVIAVSMPPVRSTFGWENDGVSSLPRVHSGLAIQRMDISPDISETVPGAAESPLTGELDEEPATSEPDGARKSIPLVVDDGDEPGVGQMRRSDFLRELKSTVTAEAEAALKGTKWSVEGCPWIEQWFAYYQQQNAAHVDGALRKYLPESSRALSAAECIPLVVARVRRAIDIWSRTGRVTGVPEKTSTGMPAMNGSVGPKVPGMLLQAKALDGGIEERMDPLTVQSRLGAGQSLDTGTSSRLGSVLGGGFSNVRVHTDGTAAELSRRMNARAFTVGNHIAFGRGEFRPGTPEGDGLLAHELAHVAQQSGATAVDSGASYNALEMDAEQATAGAITRMYGGGKRAKGAALAQARSGLTLQRCQENDPAAPELSGYGSPEARMDKLGGTVEFHDEYEKAMAEIDRLRDQRSLPTGSPGIGSGNSESAIHDLAIEVEISRIRRRLSEKAISAGFAKGLSDYEALITWFHNHFRDMAVKKAIELLVRSRAESSTELGRYGVGRQELSDMFSELAPIREIKRRREKIWADYDASVGTLGVQTAQKTMLGPTYQKKINLDIEEQQKLRDLAAKYPLLAAFMSSQHGYGDAYKLEDADNVPELGELVRGTAQERIDNVDEVVAKLREKPDLVWGLDKAIAMTEIEMGITSNILREFIDDRIKQEKDSQQLLDFMFAFANVLVVVASIAGAPVSLAIGAGLVINGVSFKVHLDRYQFDRAAARSDFDRAKSLTSSEPDFLPLAFDILGLAGDLVGALDLFMILRAETKAFAAGRITAAEMRADVTRIARQSKVPPGGERDLIESVEGLAARLNAKQQGSVAVIDDPGIILDPNYRSKLNMIVGGTTTGIEYAIPKLAFRLRLDAHTVTQVFSEEEILLGVKYLSDSEAISFIARSAADESVPAMQALLASNGNVRTAELRIGEFKLSWAEHPVAIRMNRMTPKLEQLRGSLSDQRARQQFDKIFDSQKSASDMESLMQKLNHDGKLEGRLLSQYEAEAKRVAKVKPIVDPNAEIIPTGDIDPAAEALARRINGQASVKFRGIDAELDAVSDRYVGQTTDAVTASNDPNNYLGRSRRIQIRRTLEIAKQKNRIALFEFKGGTPHAEVVDFIKRNAERIGATYEISE